MIFSDVASSRSVVNEMHSVSLTMTKRPKASTPRGRGVVLGLRFPFHTFGSRPFFVQSAEGLSSFFSFFLIHQLVLRRDALCDMFVRELESIG